MPAAVAVEANACNRRIHLACGTGSCTEEQQMVKTALTMHQQDTRNMAASGNGSTPAAVPGVSKAADSSLALLLKQGAPRITTLEIVLQQELKDLTANQHQLALIKQLVCQQQLNGTGGARPAAAVRAGSRSSQSQQQPIRVMPLLGLTLAQLVTHLQQYAQQQQGTSIPDATLEMMLLLDNNPLTSALSGNSSSPFLLALHAEVQRARGVISTCYALLEEEVASIGQQLPPAVDTDGSNGKVEGKGKGRKQRVSNSSSNNDTIDQRPSVDTAAAPMGTETLLSVPAQPLDPAYGTGLDLDHLQKRAAAVSYGLVQLDDFIAASTAQLAHLALQYDTLLTAAATKGCPMGLDNSSGSTPTAANGHLNNSGLLGMLARRHPAKPAQQLQQQSSTQDVEYLLMTLGVCSHSSPHKQSQYIAGVPPDIYHQAVRKLLASSNGSEPTLWGLSVVYARLHHAAETAHAAQKAGAEATEWTAPDQFTRSTTKYWVHPTHIMRLKLALLQQLPVLIYGAADPVYRGDISSRAALAAGSRGTTSLVSSVYFDSPALDVFHTRLAREDGARLVRMRYYGARQTGPSGEGQAVFVERKTHRESWTGERSVKERASLTQGQVPAFLAGQLPLTDDLKQNKEQLLQQVHEFLTAWQQGPALRTEYLRTAFQRYDSNSVRLSLDEHMLLLRERGLPHRPGDWCADLESHVQLSGNDAVRFPYGILEIKLQEEAPEWVKELKASGVLVPVKKFSKFLHGMALLYPEDYVQSPSWFTWDQEAGCAVPACLDEARAMAEERRAIKQQEKEAWEAAQVAAGMTLAASSSTGCSPGAAAPAAGSCGVPSAGLALPILAALKIPRLYTSGSGGAAALPTAPATPAGQSVVAMAPITAAAPDIMSAVLHNNGTTQHSNSTLPMSMSSSEYTTLQSMQHDGSVLRGAGMHTPVMCCVAHGPAAFGGSNSCDGDGCRTFLGGGSGPFNAGVNDSIGPHGDSQSDTSTASESSSYKAAQAAAAQRGALGSNGSVFERASDRSVCGVHCLPLGSNSLHQQPLLGNQQTGLLSSTAEASDAEVHGSSPRSRANGGIRKFMDCVMGGMKSRTSGTIEEVQDTGKDVSISRRRSEGLEVTNPLDLLHARPSTSKCLSTYSISSQDTITTGSGIHPHSPNAAAGSHQRRHSAETGTPVAAPTSAADDDAARRCNPGLTPFNTMHAQNSSCGIGQLSAGNSNEGVEAAQPAADAAVLHTPVNNATLVLPDVQQLLKFSSLQQQFMAPQQPQVIQVNYVHGGSPTGAAAPSTTAFTTAKHADSGAVVLHPDTATLQDVIPSVAASKAAVAVGATTALQVDGDGAGSSNGSSRGGKHGKLGRALSRLRAAGRSFAARGGSRSSLWRSNEHLLGFTGKGRNVSKEGLVRTRVEPKTFFANERTFLQWLNISVLVMMTGLGLLGGSTIITGGKKAEDVAVTCMAVLECASARISGAVITAVSVLFMLYALYTYKKRTRQILSRSTLRYDDQTGPVLLTLLLVAVTLMSLILTIHAFKERGIMP